MKPNGKHAETCGGPLRYSISALLIVLLLGLLPAACSNPEGQAVSQGEPRGDDTSRPDGEGGHPEEGQTDSRPPNT